MRTAAVSLGCLLVASSASAQLAVIDSANLAKIGSIYNAHKDEVKLGEKMVSTLTDMSAIPRDMAKYRTPPVFGPSIDTSRFQWMRELVQALCCGDARDEHYRASVQALPPLGPILSRLRLSPEAKRVLEAQYAALQVNDVTLPRAIHQTADVRNDLPLRNAETILGDDITSPRNATHYLTAQMGKAAAGLLVLNRQQHNANTIRSHTLELLIGEGTLNRNDAVSGMQFNLGVMTSEPATLQGASDALARWSLR